MKSQGGFVTIEIILVVLIISLLSTVAVPKMARMLDIARLDYEVKKFCSDFDFAHSLGRQANVDVEIFSGSISIDDDSRNVVMQINENAGSYQIKRLTNTGSKSIRDTHFLSGGIGINSNSIRTISFFSDGRVVLENMTGGRSSESFTFTSRYNKLLVSVDSVGRWRGKRE